MPMRIKELTEYSKEVGAELRLLLQQLSSAGTLPPEPATEAQLRATLNDPSSHLYCLYDSDSHIVGCATLCVFHSPTGRKASIEDVVVDVRYRGQGLGRQLMQHLIHQSQGLAPIQLHLTSRPSRTAANALYKSLGFQQKDTNCYVMTL